MSEYKRLTDKELAEKYKNHYYGDSTKLWDVYIRLTELEDKIKNGKMLGLPCKVGERIYYIDEYIAEFDKVEEYTVEKIEIVKDQIRIWFGDNIGYALAENFGKEVFTDKSQAEARLKELKGE